MRANLARIAIIVACLSILTGCRSGSGGLAWNKWKFGKSKDTELAQAPPAQYPALPSEAATPNPPDVQLAGTQYGVTPPGAISYPDAPQAGAYGVAGNGMYNPAGATNGMPMPQTGAYNPNYAQAGTPAPYGATPPATGYPTQDPYANYGAQQTGYTTGQASYTAPPADYSTTPYATTAPPAAYDPNTAVADNRGMYTPTSTTSMPPASTGMPATGDRYSNYNSGGYEATAPASAGQAYPATTPAYQPAATEYTPGNTGYQPGATGYQPAGVPAYQSPAGAYPAPSSTPAPAATTPYRPGSTSDYPGAQSGATSGATVATASYDNAGTNSAAAPAVYTPPAATQY